MLLAAIKGNVLASAELQRRLHAGEAKAGARQGMLADVDAGEGRGGQPRPRVGDAGGDGQGAADEADKAGARRPPEGRGQAMAENKLPTSPTPGQTVGLYMHTPKAFAVTR